MSDVRFISDLHFGHKSMAIKRGFNDVFEHDEYIIDKYNSVVNKRDVTYILGDVSMEKKAHYYRLDSLMGRKIIVLGNHDRHQDIKELLNYVDGIAGMIKYKHNYILTHCPIHPSEMDRFCNNIHGHVHEHSLKDKRYINVSAEVIDYTPKLLKELVIQ